MAQFTNYNSSDSGSPVLTGTSGSLINLLDACLVTGYGAKAGAGWLKPIANTTNPHAGCWRQPSGSGFVLYVNDSANAAASAREARCNGWETITHLTPPAGTGSGQFPTPALFLTFGIVPARKSATIDNTARSWEMYADDRTFYLFIMSGDVVGDYTSLLFGDIFSFKMTPDNYKCLIAGRLLENYGGTGGETDIIVVYNYGTPHGIFLARGLGGEGLSIQANKIGDMGKTVGTTSTIPMYGVVQTPNAADGSFCMSPIYISEVPSAILRGKMRGMYMLCHAASNFSDGQMFSGANEYTGKTFRIVKPGKSGGMWVIETSNTLDTN